MTQAFSSRAIYERFCAELRLPPPALNREIPAKKFRQGSPASTSSSRNAARSQSNFRFYLHHVAFYKRRLAFVVLLGIFVRVCETLQPRLIGEVIDDVLQNSALDAAIKRQKLAAYTCIAILLLLLARTLDAWRDLRTYALNALVTSRLRRLLFAKFVRLPLARLHEIKVGGVVSCLMSDLESVAGIMQLAFVSPMMALTQVILALGIVWLWNPRLALILVLLLVPMGILSFLWIGPLRNFWKYYLERRNEADARLNETFSGIRVVRAFQRETREELRYAVSEHALARLNLRGARHNAVTTFLWTLLVPLANLAILFFGGYMLTQSVQQASVGQISGMMGYTGLLMGPVWTLVQTFGEMQRSLAALGRTVERLREPNEVVDAEGAVDAPARVEDFVFDHVDFAYVSGTNVICDFSLAVPRGAMVAIVGHSGSGKSTLADLIARFYQPTAGEIRLNGIPIDKIRIQSYRRLLGVVSQDIFLFDGTIAENLAYGRPEATREEVIAAARQANAHDFIAALPQGYDSRIGERGASLSGGERQRLSIARAIIANAQILIFDEATSALDTHGERVIQAAMESLQKGRTTFVIAHRLSSIVAADIIVVLEKGRIVECGTHAELTALRGRFWHMLQQR